MYMASRSLVAFRTMVHRRSEQLRELAPEDLRRAGDEPIQRVTVGARRGTIAVIVQQTPTGALKVVIQGFLRKRLVPIKDVAIDGFYKYPDGAVADMSPDEFYDFD